MRTRALFSLLLASAAAAAARADEAPLDRIQREFRSAIERVTPATVSVLADGSEPPGVSGVLVSRTGLVLSDWLAGGVVSKGQHAGWTARVHVRVPEMKADLRTVGFTEYTGRIVKAIPELHSALVQLDKPASGSFPSRFLVPDTSARVHVGSFTFVAGNAFGDALENPPTMTAGVLAAQTPLAGGDGVEFLYSAAASNPGVSGGPFVDAQGRLVGIVWGHVPITQDDPFELLTRAVPIDRLRAAYAAVPEARDAFGQTPSAVGAAEETRALESVIARAAARAYPSVASLVVRRSAPLSSLTMGAERKLVALRRYEGPASAVVASPDGVLVTSLYNLTNVAGLLNLVSNQELPRGAHAAAGLETIASITACFRDGTTAPARVVAIHERLGIAVLRADVAGRTTLEPAPASAYEPGRFVIPVANPFGTKPLADPLVDFGVVSKRHPDDIDEPWRGQLQTDAGGTDGDCGAAVVDLDGRIVGILTLWEPVLHGRNSGIAFIVPWDRIAAVLPEMSAGHSFKRPFLGIAWDLKSDDAPVVGSVVKGSAAEAAGLRAGDVLFAIDGVFVATIGDAMRTLSFRWAGDKVRLLVDRHYEGVTLEPVLGARE